LKRFILKRGVIQEDKRKEDQYLMGGGDRIGLATGGLLLVLWKELL